MSEQELQALIGAQQDLIEQRRKRIDDELTAMGDRSTMKDDDWAKEWAGTYYTGDGLGMNVQVAIAPKTGVTYTWHGCMGLYDANHGDIVETFPGGLKVKLAIDTGASTYEFMSEKLYFVRWGERRYLVPEARMMKLVNNYNEGGFAREEMYDIPLKYNRADEVHRRTPKPPGRPQLPPEYAKLIITKPGSLTVSKVTPSPARVVTGDVFGQEFAVELDGGSDQGAFVGMEIQWSRGVSSGVIIIEEAGPRSCKAHLRMFGSKNDLVPPPVGERLALPGASADEEPKPQTDNEVGPLGPPKRK